MSLLIGFGLAVIVAAAAWKAKALSPSGGLAAGMLGTVIFGLGGLGWAVLLLAFFISSSALSRLFKQRKAAFDEKFAKGSQRDAGQVLANGGVAGVFVLLHVLFPTALWPWAAFAGALAAANADTWATELGTLSRSRPRAITTGKIVERGTSGGVTGEGTLAALGGALLIGLLAVVFWQGGVPGVSAAGSDGLAHLLGAGAPRLSLPAALLYLLLIGLAGLAGSLFNSFLGATVQAIYTCPACAKETERHPTHTCGSPTVLKRGWPWMSNDWVNGLCTLIGGGIMLLVIFL